MLRCEFPRPEYARKDYRILHGEWDFKCQNCAKKIEVPFMAGTPLSRINYGLDLFDVWYNKEVSLSKAELSGSVLLNFLGIQKTAHVFINGVHAATHVGAYGFFSLDITAFLTEGNNVITINALSDDKTMCGIWQPVWLEFTSKNYIVNLRITPLGNAIIVQGMLNEEYDGKIRVTVYKDKAELCGYKYKSEKAFMLSVPLDIPMKNWDILDANIYDVKVDLLDKNGTELDGVKTYTAFRNVELKEDRLLLNGKPIYLKAIAKRLYFNESGMTCPDVNVFKQILSSLVALGFNALYVNEGTPSILKVYADYLGIFIVEANPKNDENDWHQILNDGFCHPSIVFWQPITEVYDNGDKNNALFAYTKSYDPKRAVLSSFSNFHDCDALFINLKSNSLHELYSFFYGEGFEHTKKKQKLLKKTFPNLLSKEAVKKLPKLVGFGNVDLKKMSLDKEADFIKLYSTMTKEIIGAKALGYVYFYLNDDNLETNGIIDSAKDAKLSKNAQREIFLINSAIK